MVNLRMSIFLILAQFHLGAGLFCASGELCREIIDRTVAAHLLRNSYTQKNSDSLKKMGFDMEVDEVGENLIGARKF